MALDPGVVDSVVNSNFKIIAEQVATNVVGHQHRLQILAEKALANSLMSMDTVHTSVPEGLGLQTAAAGGLAGQVAALGAAVATLQQLVKGAITTPPVTGVK
jgi:hypothetical protein